MESDIPSLPEVSHRLFRGSVTGPEYHSDALSDNGLFHSRLPRFVPRRAQQEMALEVGRVLTEGGTLVAESGTGTGKTYAYLVPVIEQGVRAVISTGTRHLQDQIFHRDISEVGRVLGRSVNAVMLKGRSNYLCRYRLRQAMSQTSLTGDDDPALAEIARWAASTREGDIAEMQGVGEQAPVWRLVTSTSDNCLGGKCPEHAGCHVMKARQKALQGDIVVVNHHLFLSDRTLKDDGFGELLPHCDAVIFDEAHSLPSVASDFFGFSLSSFQLEELCRDIVVAEREEGSAVDFTDALPAMTRAVAQVNAALHGSQEQILDHGVLDEIPFRQSLDQLDQSLESLRASLELAAPAGDALDKCHQRAVHLQGLLDEWAHGRDRNLVRWLSRSRQWFRLRATPLRIDARFREMMQHARSWIFTSATLAVGDDFSAYTTQLGIDGSHRRWGSPYDFRSRSLLYLPASMPDPRDKEYPDRLTAVIQDVLEASRGRAFCLFTSYGMMNRIHSKLRDRLPWPVLLQGEAPRSELMDRFRQSGGAVLFGTASFWEGVDVPGEALSCVIIDRLPFAAPSDPVLKSRLRACEEEGGNPFMDIQVPAAVQALKQGAGRLIRSEQDRGVLVICDPRIRTSRYGALFLQSLPPMPTCERIEDVTRFFQ